MKSDKLKENNGEHRKPTYLAYKGKMYDISSNERWKSGLHMLQHKADQDLVDLTTIAPHPDSVLDRFAEGGISSKDKNISDRKNKLKELYRLYHPHPMLVHFPIALLFFSGMMEILFLLTKNHIFDLSAFFSLVVGGLLVYPAMMSGILSWWINYDTNLTTIFKLKITFSIVLLVMTTTEVLIKLFLPGEHFAYVYGTLLILNVPVVFFVAKEGGQLVWSHISHVKYAKVE